MVSKYIDNKELKRVMKQSFVIHPPLQMAGNGRGRGLFVNHHIGVIPQAPQGFHPVQVLFMGAAVVRQQIHPAQPWVPDGSPLQKLPERPGQVLVGVIPCKVNGLCPYLIE